MAAVALIAAGGIFWGCQKDDVLNNPDEGLMLKKATVKVETPVTFGWTEACAGEITAFTLTGDGQKQIKMWGWNTTDEEYDWIQVANAGNSSNPLVLDTALSAGTYYVIYKIGNIWVPGNSSLDMEEGIEVVVENCDDCEESFSYETDDNLSVVFTYVSDVDISDAEIKLTCPHITDFQVTQVVGINNVNNPTVLTFKGDIIACTPVTIEITFTPDCIYNENSEKWNTPNIWTDFKVNEVSKKNVGTPNIVYSCK